MQLFRKIKNFPANTCVATIGNFDGVHLGHQQLIRRLKEKGNGLNLPSCCITFEPQPNEFFTHSSTPARLMRFHEKFIALERFELEYLLCLHFNKKLSELSAEKFIEDILIKGMGVKYVLVGDDFRFGARRQGDINLLRNFGERYGFEVQAMDTYLYHGERVSSSRIRAALGNGNLRLAEELLGRPFRMSGRVAHGNKLGKKLGFPTANIHLSRKAVPVAGIFVVKVYGLQETPLNGVANVGNRPVLGGGQTLLEVYIFDFEKEIYGQHIEVEFVHKLRDEEYYDSIELLKEQIQKDVNNAKALL